MHIPRCSVYLDICHVNSCEVGATHSRCCMLQCVHYSMERGDAELISMATGLNDRTRAKENFQLAAEAFQKGAAAVRSACPAAQVCVVCEAPVAVVVFKCYLPACALSRSVGGKRLICAAQVVHRMAAAVTDLTSHHPSQHMRRTGLTHVAMVAGAA